MTITEQQTTEAPVISIRRIGTQRMLVPIVGTAPLIVHKFGEKARRQMLEGMQGVKAVKENRSPKADYEACFYRTPDGYGFPTVAFKAATVGAARFFGSSVKMTELRQAMFFKGKVSSLEDQALVEIVGTPRMREDIVKIGMNKNDLRYRPEFPEWRAVLDIRFVTAMLSADSVLSLVEAGGMGVGVGEWRPEKRGDFGTFTLDEDREVQFVE